MGKRENMLIIFVRPIKPLESRDGGTIIFQTAHGEPTWIMRPPDEGGR